MKLPYRVRRPPPAGDDGTRRGGRPGRAFRAGRRVVLSGRSLAKLYNLSIFSSGTSPAVKGSMEPDALLVMSNFSVNLIPSSSHLARSPAEKGSRGPFP